MSKISVQDIEKISRLAQISIANEKEQIADQISNVITWIEKLNEVETQNIEPMINVFDNSLKLNSDIVNDGDISEEVLKNAPKSIYGYFAVPKVIE
jgi:aspartyl-tRNA(Asn)/glutamyl-tRNA(Gln) amidotransferase subunit C